MSWRALFLARFPTRLHIGILVLVGIVVLGLGVWHNQRDGSASGSLPDVKPGIVVSSSHLVLPAVPGRPGALYFTVANTGTALARIVKVDIEGAAQVELHETVGGSMQPLPMVRLEPGQIVHLAPGGKHGMVFGIKPGISPGQTVEVTLHFFDGRTFFTQAKAEAAGSDLSDNPHMVLPGMGDSKMSGSDSPMHAEAMGPAAASSH